MIWLPRAGDRRERSPLAWTAASTSSSRPYPLSSRGRAAARASNQQRKNHDRQGHENEEERQAREDQPRAGGWEPVRHAGIITLVMELLIHGQGLGRIDRDP